MNSIFYLLLYVSVILILEVVMMNVTTLVLYRKVNSKFKSSAVFSTVILLIVLMLVQS